MWSLSPRHRSHSVGVSDMDNDMVGDEIAMARLHTVGSIVYYTRSEMMLGRDRRQKGNTWDVEMKILVEWGARDLCFLY